MDDYLSKPVQPDRLYEKLAQLPRDRASLPQQPIPQQPNPKRSHSPKVTQRATEEDGVDLDWEGAMKRFQLSPDAMVQIAETFVEDCANLLQQIQQAIAAGDSSTLQRTAHTLKGTADIYSARRVVRLALQLENKGREQTFEGAEEIWQELNAEAQKLMAAIEDALRDAKA